MTHVVLHPSPPYRAQSGAFELHQVPAAEDNLCWLLHCTRTGATAVIDGPDASTVLPYAAAQGLTLSHVLNTHTHGDHIGVNHDLAARGLLSRMTVVGHAPAGRPIPGLTHSVDEGSAVEVGALRGRVLRIDGHLEGHICFVFEEVLFSGDTLFAGGCGRVFTGDYAAMHAGLSRMAELPAETRVCCAHEYTADNLHFASSLEPHNQALIRRIASVKRLRAEGRSTVPSTVGEERATNPMLRQGSPELLASLRAQLPEAELSTPLAIFTATRKLKDRGDYRRVASPL